MDVINLLISARKKVVSWLNPESSVGLLYAVVAVPT